MFIVFSFASPYFMQFSNIVGILLATSVNGILALGVTFVIISGGIDLICRNGDDPVGCYDRRLYHQSGLPAA